MNDFSEDVVKELREAAKHVNIAYDLTYNAFGRGLVTYRIIRLFDKIMEIVDDLNATTLK